MTLSHPSHTPSSPWHCCHSPISAKLNSFTVNRPAWGGCVSACVCVCVRACVCVCVCVCADALPSPLSVTWWWLQIDDDTSLMSWQAHWQRHKRSRAPRPLPTHNHPSLVTSPAPPTARFNQLIRSFFAADNDGATAGLSPHPFHLIFADKQFIKLLKPSAHWVATWGKVDPRGLLTKRSISASLSDWSRYISLFIII